MSDEDNDKREAEEQEAQELAEKEKREKRAADKPRQDFSRRNFDPSRPQYLRRIKHATIASALPFRDNSAQADADHRSPVWLISFTDLMALMLTFFVLTFSMSAPDENKWPLLEGSLNKEFNKFDGPKKFEGGQQVITLPRVTYNRALNLDYLAALLTNRLTENAFLQDVVVIKQRDRLLLSLPGDLLFESGQATISSDGRNAIEALVPALSRIKNAIEIAGHADPSPLGAGSSYVSNWHLSLERARSVAQELKEKGYERALQIEGYASGRFEELDPNIPEETRMNVSRRVDIVVLGDDGKLKKQFELGLEAQKTE